MTEPELPDLADEYDDPEVVSLDAPPSREQDPVSSLRDVEAESGDEEEVDDTYVVDRQEAEEADAKLDSPDAPDRQLD